MGDKCLSVCLSTLFMKNCGMAINFATDSTILPLRYRPSCDQYI